MNKNWIYIILILLNLNIIKSAELQDSSESINYSITMGIGLSSDLDSISKHTDRSGLAFNLKFLVKSYTNLSMGFEISYINISKFKQKNVPTVYGLTDIDNSLTAIPILLVAQHKLYFLEVFGGYGPSFVMSKIDSFGEKSNSNEWDYSLMAGIQYSYNINPNFSVNIEGKYYTIPPLFKNILNANISLTYKL